MATHVFIVNDETFESHLRYLFAGTGVYSQARGIWLDEHPYLLSDIKRVRAGDAVIFYLEATAGVKGGFYGIFRVADQTPLVFHVAGRAGFDPGLPMKLIYRTLLEPLEVCAEGVPEFEALDKLPGSATDVQWSLIYRKLKGKRGCTPLLPWEAQSLTEMIQGRNDGRPIADATFSGGFQWDREKRRILAVSARTGYPYARSFDWDTLKSICDLQTLGRAYEIQLQLYFSENIGSSTAIAPIVGRNVVWFGNEVPCGVGMQKIDVLTICQKESGREYRLVELKDESVKPGVVEQIEYYVNWASQASGRHLEGAASTNLQPVVVAPPKSRRSWPDVARAFSEYNRKNVSLPILYFEFGVSSGKGMEFTQVTY